MYPARVRGGTLPPEKLPLPSSTPMGGKLHFHISDPRACFRREIERRSCNRTNAARVWRTDVRFRGIRKKISLKVALSYKNIEYNCNCLLFYLGCFLAFYLDILAVIVTDGWVCVNMQHPENNILITFCLERLVSLVIHVISHMSVCWSIGWLVGLSAIVSNF